VEAVFEEDGVFDQLGTGPHLGGRARRLGLQFGGVAGSFLPPQIAAVFAFEQVDEVGRAGEHGQ
jgi:hypothetical protein